MSWKRTAGLGTAGLPGRWIETSPPGPGARIEYIPTAPIPFRLRVLGASPVLYTARDDVVSVLRLKWGYTLTELPSAQDWEWLLAADANTAQLARHGWQTARERQQANVRGLAEVVRMGAHDREELIRLGLIYGQGWGARREELEALLDAPLERALLGDL